MDQRDPPARRRAPGLLSHTLHINAVRGSGAGTPESGRRHAGATKPERSHPRVQCLQGVLLGAALAACSLLLAACTTSRQIVLPDNPHAYVIDCSGANLSWSHCYQQAGRACPRGYAVTKNPYKHDKHVVAGDFLQLLGDSAEHRRMLIECRGTHRQALAPGANSRSDDTGRRGLPLLQR